MLLPVGTVGRGSFRPYVTFGLIVINVIFAIIELTLAARGLPTLMEFFRSYALSMCGVHEAPILLTLRNATLTMFLHGSFMHILFNMVFLWIFAPRVEEWFGHKRFLLFYLIVGLMASFAQIIFGGISCPPTDMGSDILIGASGAIAGVMGGFLILFPGAKIRTFAFIRILNVPAFLFLGIWVLQDILSLWKGEATMVAHWAHVGGFFAGVGILFVTTMFVPAPRGNPLEHLDD